MVCFGVGKVAASQYIPSTAALKQGYLRTVCGTTCRLCCRQCTAGRECCVSIYIYMHAKHASVFAACREKCCAVLCGVRAGVSEASSSSGGASEAPEGGGGGAVLSSWDSLAATLPADIPQQPKMLQGGTLRDYQMQVWWVGGGVRGVRNGGWCQHNSILHRLTVQ